MKYNFSLFLVSICTLAVVLPIIVSGTEHVNPQCNWNENVWCCTTYCLSHSCLMFLTYIVFMPFDIFPTVLTCLCRTYRWSWVNWISYWPLLLFDGFDVFFWFLLLLNLFSFLSLKLEEAEELYDESSYCDGGGSFGMDFSSLSGMSY